MPVSSANRIPALLEGKIDLECGSTTNTRDRQKQVAFAYTTFVAGIKMLAKKSSNVNSVDDLRGKTVVVTNGHDQREDDEAAERRAPAEAHDHRDRRDHNESFKAVDDGNAVAFPMDDVLLYGLISKSKKPDDFAVVGKYLSVEPYAIMMRKDEPQLERVVNRALVDLFQSGEIRRIYAKWFATKDLTVPLNQYLKEAFSGAEHLSGVAVSARDARTQRGRRARAPDACAAPPLAPLPRDRDRRRAATAPSASSARASRTPARNAR